MRILTLKLCFLVLSCINTKNSTALTPQLESKNWCPEDGICKFQNLKNKKLVLNQDKFGNSYTEIIEGNNIILKFEYTRKKDETIQDADYKEIIYIELNDISTSFKTENLNNHQIIFERLCFCRTQTGSFLVNNGTIKFTRLEDNNSIELNFTTDKVPHVLKYVEAKF